MPHIDELLALEADRREAERSVISALTLLLRTEDGEVTTDLIRPAVPTLDIHLLGRLVALRLSGRQFSSGVEVIEIRSTRVQPSRAQEELFGARGRDLQAGARAIAAIRARFGDTVGDRGTARRLLAPRTYLHVCAAGKACLSVLRSAVPVQPTAVRRILHVPQQARQVPDRAREGSSCRVPGGIPGMETHRFIATTCSGNPKAACSGSTWTGARAPPGSRASWTEACVHACSTCRSGARPTSLSSRVPATPRS